jgi:hypothetical protein
MIDFVLKPHRHGCQKIPVRRLYAQSKKGLAQMTLSLASKHGRDRGLTFFLRGGV